MNPNQQQLHMALQRIAELEKAAKPFLDGFTYNPGHSDLDNEQPIHVSVTLGDWRKLNMALASTVTKD